MDEREMKRLMEELKRRNEDLTRFAYSISHDLRTPLVSIRGFIGELRQDLKEGNQAEVDKDIQIVEDSARRMADMICDLLELLRAGKLDGSMKDVDMDAVIADVLQILPNSMQDRTVRITVQPSMPKVRGDRARLYQVCQNLVENALKYRQPDVVLELQIGAEVHGDKVQCYFKDNGIGIEPVHQGKIFDMFEKLDQKSEGTGIGLALVKNHLESMGGEIWVKSDGRNQGSTFFLTLPLAQGNS
jgi:signal transduction histidine kinase